MDPFQKYLRVTFRFLSYRPRSEKEVRDNLLKKKVAPDVIEKIINFLRTKNFLDDEAFTKWWIEQRTKITLRSLRMIKQELRQKGIAKEVIESQISNSQFSIANDLERAKKLIEKKMKILGKFSKQEVYQKLGRYLAGRGFDFDTIKESIDEVFKDRV